MSNVACVHTAYIDVRWCKVAAAEMEQSGCWCSKLKWHRWHFIVSWYQNLWRHRAVLPAIAQLLFTHLMHGPIGRPLYYLTKGKWHRQIFYLLTFVGNQETRPLQDQHSGFSVGWISTLAWSSFPDVTQALSCQSSNEIYCQEHEYGETNGGHTMASTAWDASTRQ